MGDLILYMGCAGAGYYVGTRIRNLERDFSIFGLIQNISLVVMVVLMGMRMGSNKEVIDNLGTIGVTSLVITVFSMVFTVVAIFITRNLIGIDRYGLVKGQSKSGDSGSKTAQAEKQSQASPETPVQSEAPAQPEKKEPFYKSMTFRIIASVVLGMGSGYLVIRRVFADSMDAFDSVSGIGIKVGLCVLLVFVGLDMGIAGTVVANIRRVGIKIFAFPVAVIIGTFVGVGICSLFFDFSVHECIAVGAGFGWYTLAPGILMEKGFVTLSAVSFLHNVMRENIAIIMIPVVAKYIGYVECTGLAGSAAMDVCLLIAEKATNSETAVYSFITGVVLSIMIPIFMPLII